MYVCFEYVTEKQNKVVNDEKYRKNTILSYIYSNFL